MSGHKGALALPTNLNPAKTIEEARAIAASQPNWLVGYEHDSDDTMDFLSLLTAHADARLWARLHEQGEMKEQGGPYERGTEAWAGMVAQEILRMQNNLHQINQAAFNAISAEIERRALYYGVWDSYENLQEMLLDVAKELSGGQLSETKAVAEIIIPWLRDHADDCACGHRQSEHADGAGRCLACQRDRSIPTPEKCRAFQGPPDPQEFWGPGHWERLRQGIALMKSIIASEQEGERTTASAIEGMWTVVDTFTNERFRVKDLRVELALQKPDPILYKLERVVPPGQEPPDEERKWCLTFPEVTRTQRKMILGRLGARAKQIESGARC